VQICQKCQGASRGHLCDSTAFLFFAVIDGFDHIFMELFALKYQKFPEY